MNEVVATVEKQLLQAKGMSLSDIEHSIGTLLAVSYTHLTLPTIYSV